MLAANPLRQGGHYPDPLMHSVPATRQSMNGTKYQKRVSLPFLIAAPGITIIEWHFECNHSRHQADVRACLFLTVPVPGWKSYEGATRLIDLNSEPDAMFAALSKGTRYEINRARRDGVGVSFLANPDGLRLAEFMDYYDAFAVSKGLPRVHREYLGALAGAGKLAISLARDTDDSVLAAHSYLVNRPRVRLMHSGSLFRIEDASAARAQIGRANRLLHWHDLIAFREIGMEYYDFGGWYEGSTNAALLRINAFKREFGGEIAKEWSSFQSASPLGAAYLTLRHLRLRRMG